MIPHTIQRYGQLYVQAGWVESEINELKKLAAKHHGKHMGIGQTNIESFDFGFEGMANAQAFNTEAMAKFKCKGYIGDRGLKVVVDLHKS
jgi:hypothetical protein